MSPAPYTPSPAPVAVEPDVTAWVDGDRVTRAQGISYEGRWNDMGSWSMSITNVEGVAETERSWFDYGTVVTIRELGTAAFIGIVEEIVSKTVAPTGGQAAQTTTYSGRSIIAELDRAIVYGPNPLFDWVGPPFDGLRLGLRPYPEVRHWNYASPELDRSAWTSAVQLFPSGQNPPAWPPAGFAGAPTPWPYPGSYWIAPRAISGGAHPAGDWYTTADVATSGAFSYDMFLAVASGDEAWVWWDGELVAHLEAKDGLKPLLVNIAANDATHRIVVRVRHGGSGASGDITGFNCALFRHYADGGGLLTTPLLITAAGWDCLDFGQPTPGFTIDQIGNALITDAQARGALPTWSTSFGSGDDTRGERLPKVIDATTSFGTKVIDTLKELSEDYIEFNSSLTTLRELNVWNIPGVDLDGGGTATGGGTVTAAELIPGVNVTELTHHGTATEVTALVARWEGGYMEVHDPDVERLEGYLSLPNSNEGPQVLMDTARQRARLATPGESIEGLRHRVEPGLFYQPGDSVTVPDRFGTPTLWRVDGRAVTTDDQGRGSVVASLGTPRDTEQARNERWQRRTLGTLDGRSERSRPASPWVNETRTLTAVRLRFSTGGSGVTIVGDRGTPERPDETLLVVGLELESDVAGTSGPTTVRLEKNASSVGTATMASSIDWGRTMFTTPVLITVLDQLNVETTAAGGHQGTSATAICMAIS